MRLIRRRPSPAMVVALIALFVALGGPAQAKRVIDGASIRRGTITTKQIKNGSVAKADLSKAAVHSLTATPASSVARPSSSTAKCWRRTWARGPWARPSSPPAR